MRPQLITNARRARILIKALLLTYVFSIAVAAQTRSATDGSTPLGLQPGSPAGSYALSGFDNVNLYNGNLSFQLSLLGVAGRGGAQMPVMLPIAGKWRVSDVAIPQPNGTFTHRYLPLQSWWENNERKYSPGTMAGRQAGLEEMECADATKVFAYSITRLTFTAPDGTEYELRDQLTGGQPADNRLCNYLNPQSRGTVFITADGSAATFVSDATIYDQPLSPDPGEIYPSGYFLLAGGSRYRIDNGLVSWVRDRNGNMLGFSYDGNNRVSTITDSLKRQVTIIYNTGPGTSDQIVYKGFGGAARTILVNYASLANALRSDYLSTLTPKALFPELNGSSTTQHNPTIVGSVTLPNGKQYVFKYNQYGELARVVLPTGGAIEYDYGAGVSDYASGAFAGGYLGSWVVYRRVIERRVYPAGGTGSTYASRMTYSRPEYDGSCADCVISEQRDNSGALLTRSRHYFYGSPRGSFGISPIEYAGWKQGREYQTENFASNGTTVLTRSMNTWQQRAAVSWWSGSADLGPPNDPRLSETSNTLVDTNQVSKQTFSYDDTVPFNNRSDVYEYDFGSGTAGALIRRTHTDYLKINAVNGADYTTTSIHIRSLPTQTQVFDGSGVERARTTYEYDNYASDGSHAPLVARPSISGLDAGFTTSYLTRGNLTRSTGWVLSTSTQLHSYNQYDVAGNVVKSIDARGYATLFEFADRFGAPDSEARDNTAPAPLGGLTSYAFATKVTSAAGHVSYAQFDYYLGKPVNGEDANGSVASGAYSDGLERPTQIKRAVGSSAENQTTFAYDDTARIITTSSDRDANNDNLLVGKIVYDQMGRTVETRQYEGGSNYIVTQTDYDALNRPYKTSNPFRPWQSQTAVWTTQVFDALGRVTSVTTPDGAAVTTGYSGNRVLVTDQQGKQRTSQTNASGQLKEVFEVTPNDPAQYPGIETATFAGQTLYGYKTQYDYDVLDSLVKVTQGSQQRFFMYDSLKRLIRARNPEQGTLPSLALTDQISGNNDWSMGYEYDANGNLTKKTDARGVESTYTYDALNRNTIINYSDTAIIPDVKRFYDGATNGKGRFWYFYSGGDFSTGANVDHTTVDTYDALGRPLVQRQSFKLNNIWANDYQIQRAYNRAGAVTSETYPSGHTVTYNYDSAGRLADKDAQNLAFTGNLGDGVQRTYSRGITYVSAGQLQQEQFGTTTPVYNKLFYNSRQQLAEILTSTTPNDSSWNRGKILNQYSLQCSGAGCNATDNNGNLRKQEMFIPANDQVSSYTSWYQQYDYDALNRLQRVHEYTGTPALDWQQQFLYDRWGNRRIDVANTYGTGINNRSFEKEDTTNKLYSPGDLALPDTQRRIRYDAAGNQIKDTYTGYGSATFDAENHIVAIQDSLAGWSYYTYNADGQRVRRKVGTPETWQIYGMEGELLAEYAANSAVASPQKEYGYRNGQLLITATGPSGSAPTSGLASYWKFDENSGTSAADSSGNSNTGTLTSGATWAAGQSGAATSLDGTDDYVQVGAKTSLVMSSECSFSAWIYPTGPGSLAVNGGVIVSKEGEYEIARFADGTIQWAFANTTPGWNWINSGAVAPLNQWTHVAVTYAGGVVKTYVNGTLTHTYSGAGSIGDVFTAENDFRIGGRQITSQNFQGRIDEVRVYNRALSAAEVATLPNGSINWLVTDHLGTPRIILDQTGSLTNLKRHDYLPFGEELFAGTGGRTAALGYSPGDGVRQQFTQKERDIETGLDYFGARYYGSTMGRFTSTDPVIVTPERFYDPQQFNLYAYTRNNPLRFIDPTGKTLTISGDLDEVKKQLAEMLGTDDAAKRIKFDEKTNTITVDLTGIDLNKNEGAALLNDVISSNKVYDVKIGTSVDTKGGEISLVPQLKRGRLENQSMVNLDNNPDVRYKKGDKDMPKVGVDDQIAFNYDWRDKHSESTTKLKLAPNWTTTFHELAEAYAKVDGNMQYAQAHQKAIDRETKLRDQRPYLKDSNPGSGPGTNIIIKQ